MNCFPCGFADSPKPPGMSRFLIDEGPLAGASVKIQNRFMPDSSLNSGELSHFTS
jgi:hypothetical protein